MTKEEMFKEMKEMEPVLGRGGIDIVLGRESQVPLQWAIFSTRKRVCGKCISAGSETIIILKSRPAPEQEK